MKWLGRGIVAAGVISFATGFWLSGRFPQILPRVPNASDGHIHQIDIHGWIVYATIQEYWMYYTSLFGGLCLVMIGAYLSTRRPSSSN